MVKNFWISFKPQNNSAELDHAVVIFRNAPQHGPNSELSLSEMKSVFARLLDKNFSQQC